MTILNIRVDDDQALIGVDTDAVNPIDGTRHQVTKILPLVQMSAVLAVRGHLAILIATWVMINHKGYKDFDALVDGMMELLRQNFSEAGHPATEKQLLALVGWSPRRKRMMGYFWDLQTHEVGFVEKEIDGWFCAPHDPALDHLVEFKGLEDLVKLARAQKRLLEEKAPEASGGGQLIVAKIGRNIVTIVGGGPLE